MAVGTVQSVVVCVEGTGSVAAAGHAVTCGTDANGNTLYLTSMQAYVIDPSNASYIDAVASPFDYGQAAGFWGTAFCSVVALYFACRGIGAVVDLIRRA